MQLKLDDVFNAETHNEIGPKYSNINATPCYIINITEIKSSLVHNIHMNMCMNTHGKFPLYRTFIW